MVATRTAHQIKGKIPVMSAIDTRNIARDSLFQMAEVRCGGSAQGHRVKVRNLSSGGMMAEGELPVERGASVAVQLRNIGWVEGSVAWLQGARCGIAFAYEVDAKLVRAPSQKTEAVEFTTPRFARPSSILPHDQQVDQRRLRKV